MIKNYFFLLIVFVLAGCAELQQISKQLNVNVPLSEAEVSSGLKEALTVGTNKATAILSGKDGYYGDQLVKILLPEQAAIVVNNIGRIPGGDALMESVVLGINRAAEDAAKEAAPIFINAVKSMTISDAMGILAGGNTAATDYFKSKTKKDLTSLYSQKISSSINKKIVGEYSAQYSWDLLTSKWNSLAKTTVGQIAGFNSVNVNLSDYLTEKALDGLFLKLANEEAQIRTNPEARVTAILKRVFGSQK
jgi:hypothetical protein